MRTREGRGGPRRALSFPGPHPQAHILHLLSYTFFGPLPLAATRFL